MATYRERDRNTLGACLYNLGRVLEASDPAGAAAAYRESVEVRPNEVAAARLASLDLPPPEVEATCEPIACDGPFDGAFDGVLGAALPARSLETVLAPASFGPFEIGVAQVDYVESCFVGIRYEGAWYVCELVGSASNMSIPTAPRLHQWVPGGPPEFTLDANREWAGHEDGINNQMGWIGRNFFGISDGRPVRFGSVKVGSYYHDGEWVDCDCGEEEFENGACCELAPIHSASTNTVESAGPGQIRVAPTVPNPDTPPRTFDIVRLSCEGDGEEL